MSPLGQSTKHESSRPEYKISCPCSTLHCQNQLPMLHTPRPRPHPSRRPTPLVPHTPHFMPATHLVPHMPHASCLTPPPSPLMPPPSPMSPAQGPFLRQPQAGLAHPHLLCRGVPGLLAAAREQVLPAAAPHGGPTLRLHLVHLCLHVCSSYPHHICHMCPPPHVLRHPCPPCPPVPCLVRLITVVP